MTRQASLTLMLALCATAAGADIWQRRDAPDPAFLPVDEAFRLQPVELSGDSLLLAWEIAPEHYLYEHALVVKPEPGRAGTPQFTGGEPYVDAHFGEVRIHRGRMEVSVPVRGAWPERVTVTYQGCADAGLCYPPQSRTLEVERF